MYTNQNSADRILNLCKDQKHMHYQSKAGDYWIY